MRADALGFFWEDRPVVRVLKEQAPKRTPPEPVWLKDDYLPRLEEAQAFNVHVMTDEELIACQMRRDRLVFDIECFRNYFLIAFTSLVTGHVWYTERTRETELDYGRLRWVMENFTLVGFNSMGYDIPMAALALAGKTTDEMKEASDHIIVDEWRPQDVLKKYKVKSLRERVDHIDLIEVAPLMASLKIYGGRMHCPRMQDLPFHHSRALSPDQLTIVRWYCVNDLVTTAFMHEALKEQISLRERLGNDYKLDLRSKSDAQIAESVIAEEIERLNGKRPSKPQIAVGTAYAYRVPHFMRFQSPLMNWALSVVANAQFVVAEHGSIEMPKEVSALKLTIADATYTMGIGGLHSTESQVAYTADENTLLIDRDVTSYYPAIILNLGLYPLHLGRNFLVVFKRIVDDRVFAKHRGDKVVADTLKIVTNGTFGKLGSKYSILYSPDLLIQVTLTGQLSLLMLIEALALQGFTVISANTDGVVTKVPKDRANEFQAIVQQWEAMTGFATEESQYRAYYGRDVNNYIAIKTPGKDGKVSTKTKGAYAPTGLSKNPTNRICIDAVEALLMKNVPIYETVRSCKDIRKFVTVRKVKGGAVKNGEYLGVSLRWYYATHCPGEMVYASSGNKVPRSDGAKALMDLPDLFPGDINFEWYEAEAHKILKEIAYLTD